jgi:hypothetical protein
MNSSDDDRVVMMSAQGYSQLVNTDGGKNIFWTSDINTELPIKVKAVGPGSETPITVIKLLQNTSAKLPDKVTML